MARSEFQLIQHFFQRAFDKSAVGVALGIGDDAAVVAHRPDEQLVISTDTANAGVHFPAAASGELVARRAFGCALSDLAAMAAEPRWLLLNLCLPSLDEPWLQAFAEAFAASARQFNCHLIGGDTTSGPLSISVTVLGVVPIGHAVTRVGAVAGDAVFVTGQLGLGAAGLAALTGSEGLSPEIAPLALQHYSAPQPQISAGLALRGIASAMIDISDGLVADLGHICSASGVKAQINAGHLPLPLQLRDHPQGLNWALRGGDDYQLCFTVPQPRLPELERLIAEGAIVANRIGEIMAGSGVVVHDDNGRRLALARGGYQHF